MRRILIIGGGYAGFYAAWNLEKRIKAKEAQITIVEPRPYMTYQPFLPEVVAGSVEATQASTQPGTWRRDSRPKRHRSPSLSRGPI